MVLWKRVRNAHPLGWLVFVFVETPIPLDGLICMWKRVRNVHPLGWLAFLFVETSIPLDGLICILTNFLVETVMSIIEDGPEIPK